jgi:hypothetical protein
MAFHTYVAVLYDWLQESGCDNGVEEELIRTAWGTSHEVRQLWNGEIREACCH